MGYAKSYADEWFEKQGYSLLAENRDQVTYGYSEKGFEKRLLIGSVSSDVPYLHYAVKAYTYGNGVSHPSSIFNDELEHLQMKAREMMKKCLEPVIDAESQKISHHFPVGG